jgi:FkbM family methyltransferase
MTSRVSFTRKYSYYFFSIFRLFVGFSDWPLLLRFFLKAAPPNQAVIRLRKSGARFKVRGAMDIWSVKETFLDRFYERYGTPLGEAWIIVDIGAGIGDFAVYAALSRPRSVIYAFEPFPASYALLKENLSLNGVTTVQTFPEAIGAQTGSMAIDLTQVEPLKLQSRHVTSGSALHGALAVPSLSLADAFARLRLGQCDLLKLDCEGSEYGILFNTPDGTLACIHRIVMEFHEGVSSYSHHDLIEFLKDKGFAAKIQPNDVHADLGYLYAWRS